MQIFAKKVGWSMSPTVGDTTRGTYDIVYFSNYTLLEQTFFRSKTWVKYVANFDRNERMYIPGPSSSDHINNNTIYAIAGAATTVPMGGFGFRNSKDSAEVPSIPTLRATLSSAYIAYQQALVNGLDYTQAIFPDIDITSAQVPGSESYGGFDTILFWTYGGPLAIWISLFASQLVLASHINEDRRKKLRLGMVMMGLNTGAYQISWFLYHIILSFIYSLIALGIGHACRFTFFLNANPAVIILTYWTTSVAAIGFTMMTTAIVHNPSGHMAMMIVGFLIGLVLSAFASSPLFYAAFWSNNTMKGFWTVNYVFQFGNIMRMVGTKAMGDSDSSPVAGPPGSPAVMNPRPYFYWNDIYKRESLSVNNGFVLLPSVSQSFGYILLCGLIALVVSIYLEIVFPREIGSPQSMVFFFLPSYWGFDTESQLNVETVAHRANKMSDVAADLDPDILAEYNDVMRRTSDGDPTLALAVTKMSKTFQKGMRASEQDTRAVDSVTLGADTGTVLGIVGHNGAGKTTLMSMLCGVVPVSTGDARVFGHSVSQNMSSIHSVMGVCPQEDVLWPELTPQEHLKLFAILKRIPFKDHDKVIADSLTEVGLYEVRHRMANKLSGGMKRRLSVAIALIGRVTILMLDEPTAGLDPRNRLEIWSIIERVKQNRVVILTTHSMQEAAALSDKIAVMAVGRLRAVGTPQHLVQRHGKGHQINVICKISKSDEVKRVMAERLPDAQLEVDTGARLTYSLASSKSRRLPEFCQFMEEQHSQAMTQTLAIAEDQGLIEDWGISQTTLEQVFLKLTHGGGNTDGLNSATSMQLNVALKGSEDVLGFVAIQPHTTLDEVRELMLENTAFPTDYTFLLNNAPVTRAQERSTTAYRALPSIEIQPGQGSSSVSHPVELLGSMDEASSSAAPDSHTIAALKSRIQALEAQLKDRDALAEKVDSLEAKVSKLKKKLRNLRAASPSNE